MGNVIVLLHGSANGSYSWGAVARTLERSGATVIAPDMLGYGRAPAPSEHWSIAEETEHLVRALDAFPDRPLHLVAHSLGTTFAFHLLRAIGPRVKRLTLVDPVMVSILERTGEKEALAEMEAISDRVLGSMPDARLAAQAFVDHWSGPGSWDKIGDKARSVITGLMPKVRLELMAARADTTDLAELVAWAPLTTILVGERTVKAPWAVARQLARILEAPTELVPRAGHMIPLTHPDAVVHAVESAERPDVSDFVDELAPTQSSPRHGWHGHAA
jgi:pimeloyl-ACP methyl ester carboxylesterase